MTVGILDVDDERCSFTVNIISEPFVDAANYTSIDVPTQVDEWKLSGLTPVPSSWTEGIAPPRVGESAFVLECCLHDSVRFVSDSDPNKHTANLVLGRIEKFVIKKGTYYPALSL